MNKSEYSHAILDKQSRVIKSKKIVSVLEAYGGSLKNKTVLDIGTGAGYIAGYLGQKAKVVTSVDVLDERVQKKGYKFVKVKDERLPFKDGTFDIVISNHVIEHVGNQKLHVDEIHRVLKKGGLIYMATPNKLWLTDPHYRLFGVSWLPPRLANVYVRLIRRKAWDIKPLSKVTIFRYISGRSYVNDAALDIVKRPSAYHLDTFKQIQPLVKATPSFVLNKLALFIPTIILVLKKDN